MNIIIQKIIRKVFIYSSIVTLVTSICFLAISVITQLSVVSAHSNSEVSIKLDTKNNILITLPVNLSNKGQKIPFRLYYAKTASDSADNIEIDMVVGSIEQATAEAKMGTCSTHDCIEHEVKRGLIKIDNGKLEQTSYYFTIQDNDLFIVAEKETNTLHLTHKEEKWLKEGFLDEKIWKKEIEIIKGVDVLGKVNKRATSWKKSQLDETPFEFEDKVADVVIGQEDMFTNRFKRSLKEPFAMATDGVKLIIADALNHRVLIYNAVPQSNHSQPDVVLGQPTSSTGLYTPNYGGLSSRSLNTPLGVATDGTRLFISDSGNHRVLIYNTIPTQNFAPADVVLGQPDFISNQRNQGNPNPSENTLWTPYYIATDGIKLVLADHNNHRVLIYNTIPTVNNAQADVVLGQENFGTRLVNNGGRSARSLNGPTGVYLWNNTLFIADFYNNRVLIHNSMTGVNFASADVVVGQTGKTTATAGVTANRLYRPVTSIVHHGKMYISDSINNRVLVYNSVPVADGASADLVLGQPDFVSNTPNNGGQSASSMYNPTAVMALGEKIMISDRYNDRVIVHNANPSTHFSPADVVIGASQFTQTKIVDSNTLYNPAGIEAIDARLYIADQQNNRILLFNSIPTADNTHADVVFGQPDMVSGGANYGGVSETSLNVPSGLSTCNGKYIVVDSGNYRVLIYNQIPTNSSALPDVVLGQPDFNSNASRNGGLEKGIGISHGAFCDGQRLFVANWYDNRVLIYNSIPTVNHAPADVVLGQPDLTTSTKNNGGISARSLGITQGVYSDGERLIIPDGENNRVLIYNSIPTQNFAPADVVLGQPDFTSNDVNNGGLSARSMNNPAFAYIHNQKLFISDISNHRILIYDSIPTQNFAPADDVLGQPDFISNQPNHGGVSDSVFHSPHNTKVYDNRLIVSDYGNDRVLIFNGRYPHALGPDVDPPHPPIHVERDNPPPINTINTDPSPTPTVQALSHTGDSDSQNKEQDISDTSQDVAGQLPSTGVTMITAVVPLISSFFTFLVLFFIHLIDIVKWDSVCHRCITSFAKRLRRNQT